MSGSPTSAHADRSLVGCANSCGGGGAQQGTAAGALPWRTLTCTRCRQPVSVLELPAVYLDPREFVGSCCLTLKDERPAGMLRDDEAIPF